MKRVSGPIPSDGRSSAVMAWRDGHPITSGALLFDAHGLAAKLPNRTHVINACHDRYNFSAAFLAALLRGQITLLPNDRSERSLRLLAEAYPDLYSVVDTAGSLPEGFASEVMRIAVSGNDGRWDGAPITIPGEQVAAIAFTSGTTGTPVGHRKTWRCLSAQGSVFAGYAGVEREPGISIVATVPCQHMYGLEGTILVPLVANAAIHTGQPLLPGEIFAALASVPAPRLLLTTPFHLRALARARPELPTLAGVVSATAPLTADLAAQIERLYGTTVREIYGCTEAGTVASRRTTDGDTWRCDSRLGLVEHDGGCLVTAEYLESPVMLNDVVRLRSRQEFELIGRGEDLVDIAGKRSSLSGLNTILTDLDGVIDGAFFQLAAREAGAAARLVAFVVAPEVAPEIILKLLRKRMDRIFLPRRIYRVAALPRNAAGKLPREALLDLLREAEGTPAS